MLKWDRNDRENRFCILTIVNHVDLEEEVGRIILYF